MFDDPNLNKTGQAPGNLPMGEPEDMFAGTEKDTPTQHGTTPDVPDLSQSSAIGAGKLQPTGQSADASRSMAGGQIGSPPDLVGNLQNSDAKTNVQVMPEEMSKLNKVKGPTFAKNLMIGIMVLAGVGILGGGSWLVYVLFIRPPAVIDDFTPSLIVEDDSLSGDLAQPEEPVISGEVDVVVEEDTVISDEIADDSVLFGEPIDSDSDNLSDRQEQTYNTDPNNWDTDGDGLGDGDEILIWKSDPLLPDTDGDTYSDGDEVKDGYNPIGPGKIFEVIQ